MSMTVDCRYALKVCQSLYALLASISLNGAQADGLEDFLSEVARDASVVEGPFSQGLLDLSLGYASGTGSADHALDCEYTRLFVGPGLPPVPQTASSYLGEAGGASVIGEEARSVYAAYVEYGAIPALRRSLPDDHLAVEFVFSTYALQDVLSSGCGEPALGGNLEWQIDFLDAHVLPWVAMYSEKVASNTENLFYLGFARLVRELPLFHRSVLEWTQRAS